MRTPLLAGIPLALALLAGAPLAIAQEPTFGFTDATLDAFPPAMNAYADLASGAMEIADGSTLRATLVMSALPETQPGLGIGFLFMANGTEWYVALVHAEELVYYYGRWENDLPVSSSDTSGSYTTGANAVVTLDFPLAAIPDATEITAPRGLVGDFKALLLPTGGPMVVHDEAIGEGTLVVREPPAPQEGTASEAASSEGAETASSAQSPDPTAPSTLSPQPTRDTPLPVVVPGLALALALALRRRS